MERFFRENPVFRTKTVMKSRNGSFSPKKQSLSNLLQYHKKKGHLLTIKDKLYACVPDGVDPKGFQVDPFLLSSKLTDDAIISYHSALAFWGKLHSERNVFVYSTNKKLSNSIFRFQGLVYKAVSFPKKLMEKDEKHFDVSLVSRQGEEILVTGLERTFVDVLDRTHILNNDWEEIYRSFESIEYLAVDKVIEYAFLLGNKTTVAKVGFFLDFFKKDWQIDEKYLNKLRAGIPKQPAYIDKKSTEVQQLVTKWNIIVPKSLINKNWEEHYDDI